MADGKDVSLDLRRWRDIVARYQTPSVRAAVIQICTTVLPFVGLLVLMYFAVSLSYWLVLLLALPAAGLLLRVFIIMHDCGHGSFLPSRRWNDIVGFITGVLTLTPYVQWRREHAIHHATSGNLEERGWGDITTLTVREYLSRSRWGRFCYRLYRNPVVLFGLGPLWFAVKQRLPNSGGKTGRKEALHVHATNLTLAGLLLVAAILGGLAETALVYLPTFFISGAIGIWLFYVQHQFEEAYWRPQSQWDYATAAVMGSTYLKLPRLLQWFTGNIGLHHVHHLSPRIPNYRLQRCHDETPVFHTVPTLTLRDSLRTLRLRLFDEESGRMVSFRHLRRLRPR